MFCEKNVISLTALFILYVAVCHVTASTLQVASFIQDDLCQGSPQSISFSLLRTKVRSKLQCAMQCQLDGRCQHLTLSLSSNGLDACQLFGIHDSTQDPFPSTAPSTAPSSFAQVKNCYRLNKASVTDQTANLSRDNESMMSKTETTTANRIFDATDVTQEPETDFRKSQWIVFVDSTKRQTYSQNYIQSNKSKLRETKSLVYDKKGVSLYVNTFVTVKNNLLRTVQAYGMTKSKRLFSQTSKQSFHYIWHKGHIATTYDSQSKRFNQVDLKLTKMKMFTENEYDLQLETTVVNIPTLIAWLQSGFKVFDYKYAKVWGDGSGVSLYKVNEFMIIRDDKLDIPLVFIQVLLVFPASRLKMRVKVGDENDIDLSDKSTYVDGAIFLSPYWKAVTDETMDKATQIHNLSRCLVQGHAFRVGYNNSYFDVDDVFRFGDQFLFLLPQQADAASLDKFSPESFGVRAVVTLEGRLSWCAHPFQSQRVLDSGQQVGLDVVPYVDRKEWTLAMSVHSNGSIMAGNISNLVEDVTQGKDLAVLIHWLAIDLIKRLTITSTRIKYFGDSNIEISGESKASWHLVDPDGNGQYKVSPECNLEKFLVFSTGYVQYLVYNVKFRSVSQRLENVVTYWYAY